MKMLFTRGIIGLAGVAKNESPMVQKISIFFEWYMLGIAFWLPVQWYLSHQNLLSDELVMNLNWYIWCAFLIEAVVVGACVKRQLRYFATNWMNLLIIVIACPSFYAQFTNFAMLRVIRLLILLRVIIPWVHSARDVLTLNRIGMSLLIFFIITSLSGVIISFFDAGLTDPLVGIWWAWETVTTVGYGDVVPTTTQGKIIAVIVMLLGIVLFSIITASISAYFVGKDRTIMLYNLINRNHQSLSDIERLLERLAPPLVDYHSDTIEQFVDKLTRKERKQLLSALREVVARAREEDKF